MVQLWSRFIFIFFVGKNILYGIMCSLKKLRYCERENKIEVCLRGKSQILTH
jgi:hypothetical protein